MIASKHSIVRCRTCNIRHQTININLNSHRIIKITQTISNINPQSTITLIKTRTQLSTSIRNLPSNTRMISHSRHIITNTNQINSISIQLTIIHSKINRLIILQITRLISTKSSHNRNNLINNNQKRHRSIIIRSIILRIHSKSTITISHTRTQLSSRISNIINIRISIQQSRNRRTRTIIQLRRNKRITISNIHTKINPKTRLSLITSNSQISNREPNSRINIINSKIQSRSTIPITSIISSIKHQLTLTTRHTRTNTRNNTSPIIHTTRLHSHINQSSSRIPNLNKINIVSSSNSHVNQLARIKNSPIRCSSCDIRHQTININLNSHRIIKTTQTISNINPQSTITLIKTRTQLSTSIRNLPSNTRQETHSRPIITNTNQINSISIQLTIIHSKINRLIILQITRLISRESSHNSNNLINNNQKRHRSIIIRSIILRIHSKSTITISHTRTKLSSSISYVINVCIGIQQSRNRNTRTIIQLRRNKRITISNIHTKINPKTRLSLITSNSQISNREPNSRINIINSKIQSRSTIPITSIISSIKHQLTLTTRHTRTNTRNNTSPIIHTTRLHSHINQSSSRIPNLNKINIVSNSNSHINQLRSIKHSPIRSSTCNIRHNVINCNSKGCCVVI